MIAIVNQPFSITSDKGLIDLLAALQLGQLIPSTKYFFQLENLNKTDLSIVGGQILIKLIYCFTFAALRRFPAVAVHQTLAKAEKQK